MSERPDRDTEELLAELETTLEALREELDGGRGPPTATDLLRFTERNTIPAVIATLEATVAALELLREFLRLADPGRGVRTGDEDRGRAAERGMGRTSEAAVAGAERALAELRATLGEGDLPADPESRGLLRDARELSEEIEARLREARGDGERDAGKGVDIEVRTEGSEPEGRTAESEEGDVDVEAELESIRDEVRDDQDETGR